MSVCTTQNHCDLLEGRSRKIRKISLSESRSTDKRSQGHRTHDRRLGARASCSGHSFCRVTAHTKAVHRKDLPLAHMSPPASRQCNLPGFKGLARNRGTADLKG